MRVSDTFMRIVSYSLWFIGTLLISNYFFYEIRPVKPSITGGVPERVAYYRQNNSDFNLLFIGDSRTYCGIDPLLIDNELGTRSLNLSFWAHWFPTQYVSYKAFAAEVPKDTTVVWSIGHQNFNQIHEEIKKAFPLSLPDAVEYLGMGYGWSQISENVIESFGRSPMSLFVPGLPLWTTAKRQRMFFRMFVDRDLQQATEEVVEVPHENTAVEKKREPEIERALRALPIDSETVTIRKKKYEGRVTSLEVIKRRGNYIRVELDSDFFREKQRELSVELEPIGDEYQASPEYWNTFVAILDLFEKNNVRLIINELQEAPYFYADPERAQYFSTFMKKIKTYVEERGIPYISIDFSELEDSDYFDYNHLNSVGVEKYNPLLVKELKRVL